MRNIGLILAFFLLASMWMLGCTADRIAVPVVTGISPVHSAVQQEVIARSVEMAVQKMEFTGLTGHSAYCEINGVLPHGTNDLQQFILSEVEGKLSRNGVLMIPDPQDYPKADFRCVVSVASAGADVREITQTLSSGRVAANVFLQFPTLFTSWIWLPIYITDRYYVGSARIHVHLIAQRDKSSRKISGEGSHRVQFEGEGEKYYPLVEGSVLMQRTEIDRKSQLLEIKAEKKSEEPSVSEP